MTSKLIFIMIKHMARGLAVGRNSSYEKVTIGRKSSTYFMHSSQHFMLSFLVRCFAFARAIQNEARSNLFSFFLCCFVVQSLACINYISNMLLFSILFLFQLALFGFLMLKWTWRLRNDNILMERICFILKIYRQMIFFFGFNSSVFYSSSFDSFTYFLFKYYFV